MLIRDELDAMQKVNVFHSLLQNLWDLDLKSIFWVVSNQLSMTRREKCIAVIHIRSHNNVTSILGLKHFAHYQAHSMLARTLFELAVDLALLDANSGAEERMLCFQQLETLRLEDHGCPVAFYSDKHSVFRMNRDAASGQAMTQFGRALAALNIKILCANSSQAKGRVERANRTLQDRLVKELRLAEISNVEAGNNFLPAFMERFNERFAVVPAKS